jgi:peptidoglycan/LPS O-acetylase OafA/YrhL
MKNRHYYIDWIRIFLIFSVFLFHVGMVFNNWDWHIKNDVRLDSLTPIMHFLHAWRMPLLFLVSGAGTRFALGVRSNGQYAAERTRRLLIPLLAGILILVPVQVYIEKINQYPSLFNFYLHFFEGVYPKGNFSWHHLWYLVYLFFISMIFIPFITFFRSAKYAAFERAVEKLAALRGGLVLLYLPLIGSQWLLRPYFPHETHAFINDWAFICLDFLYFLFGFVLLGNPNVVDAIVRDRKIWLGITLIASGIMFSIMYVFYAVAAAWLVYDILALLVSWTIGLTLLAFARKYINVDNAWRKQLNMAIYPVYLIHQPILIVVAYFIVKLSMPIVLKALLIAILTLLIVWAVYRFLILPFNTTRLLFGLKKKQEKVMELIPVREPIAG